MLLGNNNTCAKTILNICRSCDQGITLSHVCRTRIFVQKGCLIFINQLHPLNFNQCHPLAIPYIAQGKSSKELSFITIATFFFVINTRYHLLNRTEAAVFMFHPYYRSQIWNKHCWFPNFNISFLICHPLVHGFNQLASLIFLKISTSHPLYAIPCKRKSV